MSKKNKKVICIDFDNTIFEDEYPFVGPPLPSAIDTINKYYNKGHTIIIWSCREGEPKEEAILALEREGAKYHYFNDNAPDRIAKYGNDSRKIGCDILIDDRCIHTAVIGIDWSDIDIMLDTLLEE